MSGENANEEEAPKLIIDEDWKSQVEREKKQATQTPSSEPTGSSEPAEIDSDNQDLPDANFPMLVSMLATQALVALGQLPASEGQPPQIQKPVAKHFIDLLSVLEAKTSGNLDPNEEKMLRDILHNLRMSFIQA